MVAMVCRNFGLWRTNFVAIAMSAICIGVFPMVGKNSVSKSHGVEGGEG